MILLNNFSSETTWPVFTKFHVDPTVETGLKVCSNGYTPLTVWSIYGKKKKIKLVAVTGLGKCCIRFVFIYAVAVSLKWSVGLLFSQTKTCHDEFFCHFFFFFFVCMFVCFLFVVVFFFFFFFFEVFFSKRKTCNVRFASLYI